MTEIELQFLADSVREYVDERVKEACARLQLEIEVLTQELRHGAIPQDLAKFMESVDAFKNSTRERSNSLLEDQLNAEARIKSEVRAMIEAIPQPINGKDGIDGINGKDGMDGVAGKDGRDGVDGRDGIDGAIGKDGRDGIDGKDGLPGLNGVDGSNGADGVNGKDGIDGVNGKDGAPGRDGLNGKDAEPIHPDTLALLVNDAVEKRVAAIPAAKDGAPGRDALQIDVLPAIDLSKSYPRGTYARHSGGIVRSFRDTSPIPEGELIAAHGWEPLVDGVFMVKVEQGESIRSFDVLTMLTNGAFSKNTFKLPVMIQRGVHVAGNEYERGDVVTLDGSQWHCEVERTKERPSASKDWTLIVKHGRNGKDAAPIASPSTAPVRLK